MYANKALVQSGGANFVFFFVFPHEDSIYVYLWKLDADWWSTRKSWPRPLLTGLYKLQIMQISAQLGNQSATFPIWKKKKKKKKKKGANFH